MATNNRKTENKSKIILDQAKDVEKAKLSFSITQIVGILSFIGTAIVTIGMGIHFYMKTVDSVEELEKYRIDHEDRLKKLEATVNSQSGEINSFRTVLVDVFKPRDAAKKYTK